MTTWLEQECGETGASFLRAGNHDAEAAQSSFPPCGAAIDSLSRATMKTTSVPKTRMTGRQLRA